MKKTKTTNTTVKRYIDDGAEASFINKVFVLQLFLVCIATAVFALQATDFKRKTAEKMLCDEANQHGKALEQMLLTAEERLSDIKENCGGEGKILIEDDFIFDRVYSADYDAVFSESGYSYGDDEIGNTVSSNALNMYAFDGEDRVIVAQISSDSLCRLIGNFSADDGMETQYILFDVLSGRMPVNTGRGYGFDGSSIGFLKNYRFEKGFSAKSMFKDINENKSGYTVINGNDEKFSFAYRPLSEHGLCLMILVRQQTLYDKAASDIWKIYLPMIFVFVTVILCGVPILAKTKKTAKSIHHSVNDRRFMQIVLDQMAESSLACIFVYHKNGDSITVYRDKDGICEDGVFYEDASKFVKEHFGHTEGDIRRLKNAAAVVGSEKSMKLNLFSVNSDGKEAVLEYTLRAVKNETERRDDVVCTVIECDGKIKLPPKDGFDEVGTDDNIYNTTGIEVLLERNQWRFMWNNEECLKKTEREPDYGTNYDRAVEYSIAPHVMTSDRQLFLKTISRLQLLENYRNGVTDLCVKYRLNIGNGVYEYRILDIHLYRGGKNDEIKANLYARHLGKA